MTWRPLDIIPPSDARRRPRTRLRLVVDGGVPSSHRGTRHPGVVGPAGVNCFGGMSQRGDRGHAVKAVAPDAISTWAEPYEPGALISTSTRRPALADLLRCSGSTGSAASRLGGSGSRSRSFGSSRRRRCGSGSRLTRAERAPRSPTRSARAVCRPTSPPMRCRSGWATPAARACGRCCSRIGSPRRWRLRPGRRWSPRSSPEGSTARSPAS